TNVMPISSLIAKTKPSKAVLMPLSNPFQNRHTPFTSAYTKSGGEFMSSYECNYRCGCSLIAAIFSAFIGVIAAFLQITGVITVTPAFLWVTLGIAIGYLAILLFTATIAPNNSDCCTSLNVLLAGILGTSLFSIVILAVGITATSIASAILTGILLFFFSLTLTATACRVRCLTNCNH
ncbi:MAG: hypothetical protein IJN82_07660, partial [Clostridia bacterium]|nr:hypothetical protein [Clostridia bacterium]